MASPTAGAIDEQMKKALECPICMDLFNEPKQLECGHTYCFGCVERLDKVPLVGHKIVGEEFFDTIGGGMGLVARMMHCLQNNVQCPQCRKMCAIPEGGLKTNYALKEMANKLREEIEKRKKEEREKLKRKKAEEHQGQRVAAKKVRFQLPVPTRESVARPIGFRELYERNREQLEREQEGGRQRGHQACEPGGVQAENADEWRERDGYLELQEGNEDDWRVAEVVVVEDGEVQGANEDDSQVLDGEYLQFVQRRVRQHQQGGGGTLRARGGDAPGGSNGMWQWQGGRHGQGRGQVWDEGGWAWADAGPNTSAAEGPGNSDEHFFFR